MRILAILHFQRQFRKLKNEKWKYLDLAPFYSERFKSPSFDSLQISKLSTEKEINQSNNLSFDLKKNLETDATEFYNLSYNYINDCLKAGLVYRREFYTDRDVESSDTLMFNISLFPIGGISLPSIER